MTILSETGAALLALCRPWWTETDEANFHHIAGEVRDWSGFGTLLAKAHCAPIALRNLRMSDYQGVPEKELAILVAGAREAAMRNMRNEAEVRYLELNLFEPEGIDCVHVKGTSLARRYYSEPSLRPHRDIDILLKDEDRLKAIEFGVKNDYRFFVAGRELIVKGSADVTALYAFGREVAMVSPRLAAIELHNSIDKAMKIFPPEILFEVSEHCELQGWRMRVLPTNWLFCFLAYHGCQHNWSRLIWMIDLMVLIRSDDFSWSATRAIAQKSGVCSMVEASYEAVCRFEAGAFGREDINAVPGRRKANQIIDAVLQENGLASVSSGGSASQSYPNMSAALWLGDGLNGVRFGMNRLISLSSPSLDDYRLLPIDARRSNLHYYLRPALFAYRRIRSVFGGDTQP